MTDAKPTDDDAGPLPSSKKEQILTTFVKMIQVSLLVMVIGCSAWSKECGVDAKIQ